MLQEQQPQQKQATQTIWEKRAEAVRAQFENSAFDTYDERFIFGVVDMSVQTGQSIKSICDAMKPK